MDELDLGLYNVVSWPQVLIFHEELIDSESV